MVNKIQKKINTLFKNGYGFFKSHLAGIVFLFFIFQLFAFFNTLPYFNLIGHYFYFVFGLLWIVFLLLFKKYIRNIFILIGGVSMFILAIPMALFEIEFLTEMFGFIAFLLIGTYVIRQIFFEREQLKKAFHNVH